MSLEKNSKDLTTTGYKQPPDDYRLWIGNLDPRINEFHLLKLIQKHGAIEKFDLIFHRTGPLAGQPRGYAFVTFVKKEDALAAKSALHNKQVGTKKMNVTWAHSINYDEMEKPKPELYIPALAMSKLERKTNREIQIQAIEEKLKVMERKTSDEFEINRTVASEPPLILQFQHNKQDSTSSNSKHKYSTMRRQDRYSRPYNKKHHT